MESRNRRLFLAATLALSSLCATAAPGLAFTPVSELKDVKSSYWAYNAIQTLVEKYHIVEGYPDKTFRGSKTVTRYEMAAALAKVMAKVEEMVSTATGAPMSPDENVSPDDLRTIARLQREFRDELEVLKGRVDGVDTRLSTIEKHAKITGVMGAEYRDFLGASPIAADPFAEFRLRNQVNLDARLTDELAYHGSLFWDVYSLQASGNAFATQENTHQAYTEAYIQKSYGAYTSGPLSLYGGLVNTSEVMTVGSSLKNPFTNNIWREGTGGYGFVGTPGLSVDPGTTPTLARVLSPSSGAVLVPARGAFPLTNNVWWLPGTDAAAQALDPNSSQPLYPRASFTVAATGDLGPFSLGLAAYQPDISGRNDPSLGSLGYPASFPQLQQDGEGSRMLATLGANFGSVSAQLAANAPGNLADNLSGFNKTLAGTIDIGSDALGLSLQGVSRTAFNGNFTPSQFAATLASDDLFGTGFGLGLGANVGTVIGSDVGTGTSFQTPQDGHNLLNGLSGTDYASYGLYLRLPGFSLFPSLTLAAQQTAGPNLGTAIASGATVQADVQILSLPKLQVEYSMGKFTPGQDDSLLNGTSISNEQLTARMLFNF